MTHTFLWLVMCVQYSTVGLIFYQVIFKNIQHFFENKNPQNQVLSESEYQLKVNLTIMKQFYVYYGFI